MTIDRSYWRLVEPVWGEISTDEGGTVFSEQFSRLTREVGNLLATSWCYSEVLNGGLHQFFFNPTGIFAPEAAAGFRAIGMPETTGVVEEAIRVFGPAFPRDVIERRGILDQWQGASREQWDPFLGLTDRFYDMCDRENGGYLVAADDYAMRCPQP